jgi:acetyltransferase-like isoleucine patch superfamily enzyme
MAFLSRNEILQKGIKIGDNVLISDKCSIYGTDIKIGNNVRIDDFCILSGKITLGNNIHIGAYCALYGKLGIVMEDYTGLSPRCTIFSASDDFSGNFLISPMNPEKYTNVTGGEVTFKKFTQIGAGTVIMPDLIICKGAAVGAMSFVKNSVPVWEIWAGNPLRFIKKRSRKITDIAKQYENEL